MAKIDLWLDDYNDIYSDFDPRHYNKRRISEDFIDELKRAFANKEEQIADIVLQLPADKREKPQESLVIESLDTYFNKRKDISEKLVRKKRTNALLLLAGGIFAMAAGSVITYKIADSMWSQFLKVLIEPAGWFMLWSGLDDLFYELKNLRKERKFFKEVAIVKWHFETSDPSS